MNNNVIELEKVLLEATKRLDIAMVKSSIFIQKITNNLKDYFC